MKSQAIVMSQIGGPEVLQLESVDVFTAGEGELLLKVLASGFNPVDTKIRSGIAPVAPCNGVLGCDVCGEVVEVGQGVSNFKVGDRVYGCAGGVLQRSGSLAEFMTVAAELMARVPDCLSDIEAACVPVVGITAAEALHRLRVKAGSSLFVLGASGGVGRYAVQLGRIAGAEITGTAGGDARCAEVADLGATAINHGDAEKLIAEGQQFSHVLDTVGGESFQTGLKLAAVNAQVATINARHQYDLSQAHAKALTIHAIFGLIPLLTGKGMAAHGAALQQLTDWFDAGKLAASPVTVAAMTDAAEVHREYEARGLKQKVAFVWT